MRRLDLTLEPVAAFQGFSVTPAAPVRVYESGLFPGFVSIVTGIPGLPRGMRATREQAAQLRDALSSFLEETQEVTP